MACASDGERSRGIVGCADRSRGPLADKTSERVELCDEEVDHAIERVEAEGFADGSA